MIDLSFACNKSHAYMKFFTGNSAINMWLLREDWQWLHARLQHDILLWIGSQRLDEDNHTNTDTQASRSIIRSRATIWQDASASGWLDFHTDANTCINEAERFTVIATI